MMTKEQFRAFEDHCRASEIYKYLKIDTLAEVERKMEEWRPTGEIASEDYDRYYDYIFEGAEPERYRTIRVKGYDKDAPLNKGEE